MAFSSPLRISPNVPVVIIPISVVLSMLFCVEQLHSYVKSSTEPQPSQWKRKYSMFQHKNNNTRAVNVEVSSVSYTQFDSKVKEKKEKYDNSVVAKGKKDATNDSNLATRQEHVQLEREEHFRKHCKSYKLMKNYTEGAEGLNVLYSRKYGLAYKLVPKIGSTFMIQVFTILENKRNIGNLFNLPRIVLHDGRAGRFRTTMDLNSLNYYKLMVMARNPYSRLYSAYIDKVFILNNLSLCKDILSTLFGQKARNNTCKYDISFAQFLEYYLDKGGALLSGHYAPILSRNIAEKMCNVKNILLVKQETFSEDISYALKLVHVNGKEYETIYDAMHSKQTKTNIVNIVKTIYFQFSFYIQNVSCLTWKEIAVKLWKSFQVQGYIDKRSEFPETKIKSVENYKNANYMIEIMMQEVNTNPLTHEEKVRQRNEALLKAYKNIDKKYIRKIQERYDMDFDLFQYSKDLVNSLT